MLARLAPLALVMVAACHTAPEQQDVVTPAPEPCLLIGTWVTEFRLPDGTVAHDWSETFTADGKWIGAGWCGGHDMNHTWTVLDVHGGKVTIRMNECVAGLQERSFVFETPDRMQEVGGEWFVRARPAQ